MLWVPLQTKATRILFFDNCYQMPTDWFHWARKMVWYLWFLYCACLWIDRFVWLFSFEIIESFVLTLTVCFIVTTV